MAKKIRFPLNLADGTQARSLDELKEHFDLESVLSYYKSGKLLTWLRDRYIETEADAVEALDEGASEFQQRLCAIFGAEFSGSDVDMEEIIRRQERMKKLRQFTDEDEFIQNIDFVAFEQEELADLLDEGCGKIYLCGESFTVPASQRERTYIGINSPKVKISGNVGDDWAARNIMFSGCEVENLPAPVQETALAAADNDGPVIISDELAADIFEAIYEDVPKEVKGREIIAETDQYFVIEEVYYYLECEESSDCTTVKRTTAKHYLRFSKASCTFEELPDLSTFSVASKYYKLVSYNGGFSTTIRDSPKNSAMLSAPTYQYKDVLYIQEISDKNSPSIWRLNLDTKSLVKLMDGIKFFCPYLPTLMFHCDNRFIPVIKDKKFCVLDLRSLDLVKVRNKGQWMDIPYGVAVAGTKVYFTVDETQLGRADKDKGTFCSFDLDRREFSEVQVAFDDNTALVQPLANKEDFSSDMAYQLKTIKSFSGIWSHEDRIMIFLTSYKQTNFVIDVSSQPMRAKRFWSYFTGRSIVWYDKAVSFSGNFWSDWSDCRIFDSESYETSEKIRIASKCDKIFRIGNFIYAYNDSSSKGYRISLTAPYEQIPFTLSIDALNDDTEYDWEPVPET